MGTHSLIGIERADRTVDYIYVHYDGYLSGVGKELLIHFDTVEKASALIEGGDRASLMDASEADSEHFKTTSNEFSFYRLAEGGQGGCLFEYYYLWQENEWKFHTPNFMPLRDMLPATQ